MELTGKIEQTPLQEVLQVLAYSQKSGVLSVKGRKIVGTVLFERGSIIFTHTDSTRYLLDKIAEQKDVNHRLSLRRVQALASLTELFDLKQGLFYFEKITEPISEIEGIDMGSLYADGGMDTGDLLLLLTKAMDPERHKPARPSDVQDNRDELRHHPRFGPMSIPAELNQGASAFKGYLTNLSIGGAFFHAEDLPQVDQAYELEFKLPRDLGRCLAEAKVVWVRAHVMDASRGVGLQFNKMSTDTMSRLTVYLERFQQLATDIDPDS
jgi:Tfp pilus assembly protein PilZ